VEFALLIVVVALSAGIAFGITFGTLALIVNWMTHHTPRPSRRPLHRSM